MRASTMLFLLAAVLLVSAYGVKGLGIAALVVLGLVLLPFVLILALAFWLRWRVKRELRRMAAAVQQMQAAQRPAGGDVIDVQPTRVQDEAESQP